MAKTKHDIMKDVSEIVHYNSAGKPAPAGGRTDGLSVTEAATVCGFGHLSYFSKLFRECFGCTPTEYRRGAQSPVPEYGVNCNQMCAGI